MGETLGLVLDFFSIHTGDLPVLEHKVATAAVRGTGHVQSRTPCQDKTNIYRSNKISVIALADGAGSCKLSHIGARTVVRLIAKYLEVNFEDTLINDDKTNSKNIIAFLQAALNKKARKRNVDIKELSSTLLFIAIDDEMNYIAGHIGDGIIGILQDGIISVLSYPDNGEFLNSTVFITSPSAKEGLRLKKGKITLNSGFILLSDGSAESLYLRQKREFSPGVQKMIQWLDDNTETEVSKALKSTIRSMLRKKTTDDCSIALLKVISL